MPINIVASLVFAIVVLTGCASTKITEQKSNIGDERLPRPDRIIVYDTGQYMEHSAPQTAEQIATGRKLGAEIAKQLVAELKGMGLPAVQAAGQPAPILDDIVIRGHLVSVEEGSAGKRLLIGFGSGNAELKTVVEGYRMTPQGLRQLGSGELDAGGNKMPGMAVPLAVAVATASPIGLIVGGAVKLYGEKSGADTIEGSAKRTDKEIGQQLEAAAEKRGWV